MYICNCIVHVSRYIIVLINFFAITVNCLYSCFFLFPRLEHPAGWICYLHRRYLVVGWLIVEHRQVAVDRLYILLLLHSTTTSVLWVDSVVPDTSTWMKCTIISQPSVLIMFHVGKNYEMEISGAYRLFSHRATFHWESWKNKERGNAYAHSCFTVFSNPQPPPPQ